MDPTPADAFPRLDRSVVTRCTFAEADEADRRYWWSRTPAERWAYMEQLRRMNYGDAATGRIQLVLEVLKQPWS